MIPNRPRPLYVEAHRILELQSTTMLTPDAAQQEQAALRSFTIHEHFKRGGFEFSLFAPSDNASAEWLNRHLRNDMPLLPIGFDAPTFWSVVARRNGDPATSIQRELRCKLLAWQQAFEAALHDDLLFELPFWPDEPQGRAPLVYFSDSGLWHRAFAQFRDPIELKNRRYDAKAWEGFNVNAIRRLILPYADCYVWRRDGLQSGEIDLVVHWKSGERWAIEISSDSRKRASSNYQQGVEMLGAVRRMIVRPGASRLEGRLNYEYVNIEEALRAIAEACPANAR